MSAALPERLRLMVLVQALQDCVRAAEHWSACDFPDEVAFRCEGCRDATRSVGSARKLVKELTAELAAHPEQEEMVPIDDGDGDVPCPRCGAEAGAQCSIIDPSTPGLGTEVSSRVHRERAELAQQLEPPAAGIDGEGRTLADWQDAILARLRERVTRLVPDFNPYHIDGGGCDSGDPLDLTLSEIDQAFMAIEDAEPPAAGEPMTPEQSARDRLWCQALCETLDPREINRVTSRFQELRTDGGAPAAGELLAEVEEAVREAVYDAWEETDHPGPTGCADAAIAALKPLWPPARLEAAEWEKAARTLLSDWARYARKAYGESTKESDPEEVARLEGEGGAFDIAATELRDRLAELRAAHPPPGNEGDRVGEDADVEATGEAFWRALTSTCKFERSPALRAAAEEGARAMRRRVIARYAVPPPPARLEAVRELADELDGKAAGNRRIEERHVTRLEKAGTPYVDGSWMPETVEQQALLTSWELYGMLADEQERVSLRLRVALGLPPQSPASASAAQASPGPAQEPATQQRPSGESLGDKGGEDG